MSGFGQQSSIDARWWSDIYRGEERGAMMIKLARHIRNNQDAWRRRDVLHASLYSNLPILGFSPNQFDILNYDDRLMMNIVKPKVDTYVSLITRSKPKPMFLTSDGSWEMRRKAKGLNRWFEGKYYELNFFDDIAPMCVLDTGVFDYGMAHVYMKNAELAKSHPDLLDVGLERVYPWEIVVDASEALSGHVRNLYRRKWVDRARLAEMFPKAKADIAAAARGAEDDDAGRDEMCDQILVTEGWHLPSGPIATDGRYCMAIPGKMLRDEKYDDDELPFPTLYRQKPQYGMRGLSIAHELRPLQIAINEILMDLQEGISVMARPKWRVSRDANIELMHIDDEIGSCIMFDGQLAPDGYTPPGMSPDAYQLLWQIWQKADEVIGISGATSSGTVPSNLQSGKAVELNNDVQDGRFLTASRRYEWWAGVDIPRRMIKLARDVTKLNPKYAAYYQHKTYITQIPFKDVDLKRDEYVLKPFPASQLSTMPGQRLQQLQDLFDRGLIDQTTFTYHYDLPDLEGELNLLTAGRELTQKLIDKFLDAKDPLDPDVFQTPEPLWPIDDMRARFQLAAANAQVDGAPEGNVSLLRKFWLACDAEIKTRDAAKMPPPPTGPQLGGQLPATAA